MTPPELISEGLVNYHKFVVDFELSVSGLNQDELFPEEAIFISDLVEVSSVFFVCWVPFSDFPVSILPRFSGCRSFSEYPYLSPFFFLY